MDEHYKNIGCEECDGEGCHLCDPDNIPAPGDTSDYWNDVASDAEADADTLASAGWGTDEDYGGGFYDDY
jgi:hypothetical protein